MTSQPQHTLHVELGDRRYPIFIGSGLLGRPGLIEPYVLGKRVLIVTNDTVAPLYLDACRRSLAAFDVDEVVLPDGEKYKTLEVMNRIFDVLLQKRFDRRTTLVALGGGVIGDITGFAAATYQRGVPFIQIPTTLLSQVDSSVGGKTGVNHALGKNMIGAFYQPQCVIADTTTLETLPDRELSAGIAEVIKYGLICDRAFFEWLEVNVAQLVERDPLALAYAIERSCRDKANVVAQDERENGLRAILNFGHTFGHAIENGMGYGVWLHGEGVAAGMMMASRLSYELGWLDALAVTRIEKMLLAANLPVRAPSAIETEQFLSLMSVDKKVQDGTLRLVLLKGIGEAVITAEYAQDTLKKIIQTCRA